ncbi:glycyl-radical enzyme activating protein [Desulfosporosinus sp. BICA1-9]|uniref:glycyl-radical enzyme activating protein n=1 Tax=Desulfosporosinus sp. BICA1-9 TaxID=1531958 RepID=UPI00054BD4DA|nr:glycyl-radical enzyme activating protein [Desulfosporosinus sp. BICA1-9]KJS80061.1 MAG: radical SAM protein [Desulfosporosinus sp. BICA1-9]HBW38615.1 glycyl-radical enzyme activating protein [Desulfosporosinus sp.]
MDTSSGYFMEIQNFSVNDGNGIRTVVFFAGCPLRCQWCSNPESFYNNRISYYEKTCIKCGRCVQVCPYQAALNLNDPLEWEKCRSCGLCAEVCPTGSRKKLIHHYTSEEILKLIEKQKIFYRYSGGGVTFSGGEAMLQQELLRELVCRLYDQAVNLAIETSGCFDFDEVKDILEKMDLIFVDIKHMDRDKHKFYTRIGNERILKNIAGFNELKVPVVVRIPVIDGVNSDIENIRATAQFAKAHLDTPKIELLPYHSLGDGKYEALGLEKPSRSFKTPSRKHLMELCRIVEHERVEVVSYK